MPAVHHLPRLVHWCIRLFTLHCGGLSINSNLYSNCCSLSAQDIRSLQKVIPGGQYIEGSNLGRAANDQPEHAQHAPAVVSPLTAAEQVVGGHR